MPVARTSASCGEVETTTATVTATVTVPPDTVTLALENASQISASLASAISVDASYAAWHSELAPTGDVVPPVQQLTYTEVVPVVEATASSIPTSQSAYFVSVGINTT